MAIAKNSKDETARPAPADVLKAETMRVDGIGQKDEFVNPAQDELQKTVDKANTQGFYGVEVDPTPNEHYTIDGVTSGKPTPENPAGDKPAGDGGAV